MNNLRTVVQMGKEINYILTSKQKRRSLFVLMIIIISSGLELIGVTAILPFVQAILTPGEFISNPYVSSIMKIFHIETEEGMLLFFGIFLMFVYVLKNLFMIFSYYVQYDYSTKVQKELSVRLLHSYLERPYTYFLDVNSSEIVRGCSTDVMGVYYILSYTLTILAEGLSVVMIGIFIVCTDPLTAFGVLFLMGITFLGIVLFFKPVMKNAGKRNMEAGALKNRGIYQAVTGIKEIFVMQRKEYFIDEYESAAEMGRKTQRSYDVLSQSTERIIEGICVSGIIGVVCLRLVSDVNITEFIPKMGAFTMSALPPLFGAVV